MLVCCLNDRCLWSGNERECRVTITQHDERDIPLRTVLCKLCQEPTVPLVMVDSSKPERVVVSDIEYRVY